ncbi:MAG TPA: TonB-dependent receptor plug domain-containing protein [Edaphocola sp.]|nr:TonB-dependent receptor plug domain-containing protein [Edaphocola sp.]
MRRLYIGLILLLFPAFSLYAQSVLELDVRNSNHEPVGFALVQVHELNTGGLTDSAGHISIPVPPGKSYRLSVSCTGYIPLETVIASSSAKVHRSFILKNNPSELKMVRITGETHGAALKKNAIKAEVINTLEAKEQPSTLIELMNRSSGIRIRQAGALGSNSDVSLNGFQDRSIRYFKDGLPLNYLGAGFSMSLIPVNMLDHVEVYKGVLPAYLGADALGGAINLVTRKEKSNFVDISYELGSFNTHRVSLNAAYYSPDKKYFIGVNGFYNYSDGDYTVDVQFPDEQTGVLRDITTKLYHNRFSNYYVEAYAGIRDVKWADELRLMVSGFGLNKQFQFGTTMFKPFGMTHGHQSSVIPAIEYRKRFLAGRLEVTGFAEVNTLNATIVDTAHGHFDWLGNFTPNANEKGEISNDGTLSDIGYHYLTSRGNIRYNIMPAQTVDFNIVADNFMRKGTDEYGKRFPDGEDFLSKPASYRKLAMALGLTSGFLNKKVQNNLIFKFYRYRTEARDMTVTGAPERVSNQNHQWGIAEGIKWQFSPKSLIQFSAETALRMPEQDEIFGDGNFKLANFYLKPERSLNFNLGYQTGKYQKYHFETNVFYRRTKNMILLMPLYFLNSQSQNVDNVQGAGLDMDANYYLTPWLKAGGNFTYQDLRLVHTGNPSREGARLRNTPYFFANLGLNAHFQGFFFRHDKLDVYWYYSFVRQFYLDYIPKNMEPAGFLGLWGNAGIDAQNIIPDQDLHTIGFTYYPTSRPLAFGFQVKNLFNAKVYDNFRIQNPGRNYSVKISYSLFKK